MDVLEACKNAGVQHIIFSGLENCQNIAGIPVPNFDGKAVIEDKIKVNIWIYTFIYNNHMLLYIINKYIVSTMDKRSKI